MFNITVGDWQQVLKIITLYYSLENISLFFYFLAFSFVVSFLSFSFFLSPLRPVVLHVSLLSLLSLSTLGSLPSFFPPWYVSSTPFTGRLYCLSLSSYPFHRPYSCFTADCDMDTYPTAFTSTFVPLSYDNLSRPPWTFFFIDTTTVTYHLTTLYVHFRCLAPPLYYSPVLPLPGQLETIFHVFSSFWFCNFSRLPFFIFHEFCNLRPLYFTLSIDLDSANGEYLLHGTDP